MAQGIPRQRPGGQSGRGGINENYKRANTATMGQNTRIYR